MYVCIFVKMEYVCKELIGEYKAVVQRPKLKKYIGEKDVLDTLELMSLYCFCVDIEKPAVSPIRDVKDLYLLSLADTIPWIITLFFLYYRIRYHS